MSYNIYRDIQIPQQQFQANQQQATHVDMLQAPMMTQSSFPGIYLTAQKVDPRTNQPVVQQTHQHMQHRTKHISTWISLFHLRCPFHPTHDTADTRCSCSWNKSANLQESHNTKSRQQMDCSCEVTVPSDQKWRTGTLWNPLLEPSWSIKRNGWRNSSPANSHALLRVPSHSSTRVCVQICGQDTTNSTPQPAKHSSGHDFQHRATRWSLGIAATSKHLRKIPCEDDLFLRNALLTTGHVPALQIDYLRAHYPKEEYTKYTGPVMLASTGQKLAHNLVDIIDTAIIETQPYKWRTRC